MPLIALVTLVTTVQALATFAVLTLSTLATLAAPHYGVGPEAIGYQISLVYGGAALLSSAAGVYIRRYGAARMSAVSMAMSCIGLAGLASGSLVLGVLASIGIGFSYGLTNPAASHLLYRFSPAKWQNLIFSLKQTGVPIGGLLAALILPRIAEVHGWQIAALSGAALAAALAVTLLVVSLATDDDKDPAAAVSTGSMLAGLKLVTSSPALRGLSLMGLGYSSTQLCLFAFLITMLVKELGWSLVAAGTAASLMQIGGVIGRIAWSVFADWLGEGRGPGVLVAIGVLSAATGLCMTITSPHWPIWLTSALVFSLGFCLVGWNGLWLAEVARAAGPGQVGVATGGVLVFAFAGIVFGPAVFATVYKWIGSYAITFGVFSLNSIFGACALAWSRPRGSRPRASRPSP
ncbi:MAG: MFS transporter [Hyphomicrobiaceae bacterium]